MAGNRRNCCSGGGGLPAELSTGFRRERKPRTTEQIGGDKSLIFKDLKNKPTKHESRTKIDGDGKKERKRIQREREIAGIDGDKSARRGEIISWGRGGGFETTFDGRPKLRSRRTCRWPHHTNASFSTLTSTRQAKPTPRFQRMVGRDGKSDMPLTFDRTANFGIRALYPHRRARHRLATTASSSVQKS